MAGKAEVDLFVRSYQTLLRSTGEVRVAGLLEPYLAMDPTLHSRARNPQPDAAALTYVGLRLPSSMPDVRLVLLSTSIEAIESRGYDLTSWRPQSAPARRRRQFYDGGERVAILVNSPSDLDDLIPALVAYEIEWNKIHELFRRDVTLRRLVENAAEHGPQPGDDERLREAFGLTIEEQQRLSIVWQGRPWELLAQVAERRKRIAVRMLGGSWNDYERAAQQWWDFIALPSEYTRRRYAGVERWYEYVADNVPPDLSRRPTYFVSSNMHSLVNLLSGSALARQGEIIDYVQRSDSDLLRAEYEGITSDRVRSSLENFLYYAAKKYLTDPAHAEAALAFAAEEQAAGMTTLHVPLGPDVDAQVIELSKLRPERLDRRLADLPALDRLAHSDAIIVNIDYPLGQAGYFLQRALARNVGALLGLYVMGKGATLTGRVGDILLCNIVADERTATTYLLHNCFNAEDVERYLVYGTALDNQRAASARGTFLQNWGYLDALHRAGNNLVEMEAGPYLEAFTELMLPERAPHGEMVNLVGAPVDLGFVHYASDTPYSKGQTLGERNLSYFGMDSTYAAALAVARRILNCEVARLSSIEPATTSDQTSHAAQPVALAR
jgi:hypothetical protein